MKKMQNLSEFINEALDTTATGATNAATNENNANDDTNENLRLVRLDNGEVAKIVSESEESTVVEFADGIQYTAAKEEVVAEADEKDKAKWEEEVDAAKEEEDAAKKVDETEEDGKPSTNDNPIPAAKEAAELDKVKTEDADAEAAAKAAKDAAAATGATE